MDFNIVGASCELATQRGDKYDFLTCLKCLLQMPLDVVKELAEIAVKVAKLEEFTGRDAPTLMT